MEPVAAGIHPADYIRARDGVHCTATLRLFSSPVRGNPGLLAGVYTDPAVAARHFCDRWLDGAEVASAMLYHAM